MLIAVFALSVSCGHDAKKQAEGSSEKSDTETNLPEYKQKALEFASAMYDAEMAKDDDEVRGLTISIAEYVPTLSSKHRKIFEKTYKDKYNLLKDAESYVASLNGEKGAYEDNRNEAPIAKQEEIPISREEIKPPVQQQHKVEIKVFNETLDVVTNDTKVETEMSFGDLGDGSDADNIDAIVEEEEEIIEDAPLIKAEVMPTFQGGYLNDFRDWVQKQLRYPQIALENNITGRVTLQFVIEKDGRLTSIKVLQSPDSSLSKEAIRVVSSSPKWSPGMQRNQPVRVRYQLPVNFQLRN